MPDALAPDPFTAMAAQLTPKRAVSYIRVSTREQAQRGVECVVFLGLGEFFFP